MTTPTIIINPSRDLHDAGRRNTDAAQASFVAAYERAARRLGCRVSVHLDEQDDAGLTHDQITALWQAAHDAVRESRPGRWAVSVPASELRQQARRIRGLRVGRRPQWMTPAEWAFRHT